MPTTKVSEEPQRRQFLRTFGAAALGLAGSVGMAPAFQAPGSRSKQMRGVFVISQTPFTDANKLDLEGLAEEVKFIDRGGSHGFVWPQVASEWMTLTDRERMDGAEAIVATGKKLRPEIVIGVQSADLATAIRYAKHAEKLGADAIIALPPAQEAAPNVMMDYYKEIGKTTQLPFIVQAVGKMNVELIMEFYITPFDYSGCEGPWRALETELKENKLIGMGLGLIDWEGADTTVRYGFWNVTHQQFWYGDASLLVGFRMMPIEPQFQNTVETKYPVSGEGLPGGAGNRPPGAAPRPPAQQRPPGQQ